MMIGEGCSCGPGEHATAKRQNTRFDIGGRRVGWTLLIQSVLAFGVGLMLGMHAEGNPIWLMVLAWVLIGVGLGGHLVIFTRRTPPQKPAPE